MFKSHSAMNSRNAVLAYCGPLSLQSISGTPCSAKISFILLITAAAVAPYDGIFLHRTSWSTCLHDHVLHSIKIKKVRCQSLPWGIQCRALLQRCVTQLCLKLLASGTAVYYLFYILGHPRPVGYIHSPKNSLGDSLVSIMELPKDLFMLGIWDEECFPFKDKFIFNCQS